MNQTSNQKLNDKTWARWSALFVVAFTMMAAYYVNDIMAPLKSMLEGELHWTSGEFGFFTGAYSFLNVFLLMLIWGGLILDKFGIRFTGMLSAILMVGGTICEYAAITRFGGTEEMLFGYKLDVFMASAGYSVFGVGAEVAGITVTKIIAKWFHGKEMALAMGVQVALARVGSQVAYAVAIPVAKNWHLDTPLLIGAILLVGGLVSFLCFTFMDRKLDRQVTIDTSCGDDEKFSFKDVVAVVSNPGFWLIALLCVLFYSCVFPFQKFATELMVTKYNVSEDIAGTFAGLPALGALFLTPVFGGMIDRRGKAASIMMLGACHLCHSFHPRLLGSHHPDDYPGHRLLPRPVRHVAFRGQDIPGQTTGYGIRPDIFHPEHRIMGYPGSHWQRTRKLLHHGPGSGKR